MAIGCSNLTAGLDYNCDAGKLAAGYNKRVYIMQLADIASYTMDGTSKVIQTIVAETGKKAYNFVGKPLQNSASAEIVVSESGSIGFKQMPVIKLYTRTSLENFKVENLLKAEDLVFFMQSNGGFIQVWGLDVTSGTIADPDGGLNIESGTWTGGATKSDATGWILNFSSELNNIWREFKTASSTGLASEITYLDALVTG